MHKKPIARNPIKIKFYDESNRVTNVFKGDDIPGIKKSVNKWFKKIL